MARLLTIQLCCAISLLSAGAISILALGTYTDIATVQAVLWESGWMWVLIPVLVICPIAWVRLQKP